MITNSEMNVHLCADSISLIINCLSQIYSLNAESNTDEINLSTAGSFSSFRQNSDTNINQSESQMLLDESDKKQFNNMISDAMKEEGISKKINKVCLFLLLAL